MKTRNVKCCPNCDSTNVEEFLAGFFKANEPSLDKGTDGDVQLAELYRDLYWCPDCETHPGYLADGVEVRVETAPLADGVEVRVEPAPLADGSTPVFHEGRCIGHLMPQAGICTRKTRQYYERERRAGRFVPSWFNEAFPEVTS